ncbi:hypothetical protein M8C21_003994, partial [Ambrosia artemisiifolia]
SPINLASYLSSNLPLFATPSFLPSIHPSIVGSPHKIRIKKMGDEEKTEMLVHTGGAWRSHRTRYDGQCVRTFVLEVPSNLSTFSELKDLVTSLECVDNVDNVEFTYKRRVAISIWNNTHVNSFMQYARTQSRPVDLYLA